MPVPSRSRAVLAATLVLAAAAVAGCSPGGSDEPVRDAVAARAAGHADASYRAEYVLTSDPSAGRADEAEVVVWRTPRRLRVDVRTRDDVASTFSDRRRVVSCHTPAEGESTCLLLGRPGSDEVDPAFVPALHDLFVGVVDALADPASGLTVEAADAVELPVDDPLCFRVGGEPEPPVARGTYCLDPSGVPAYASYESGDLVVETITTDAPEPGDFEPPAEPTRVPRTPEP